MGRVDQIAGSVSDFYDLLLFFKERGFVVGAAIANEEVLGSSLGSPSKNPGSPRGGRGILVSGQLQIPVLL